MASRFCFPSLFDNPSPRFPTSLFEQNGNRKFFGWFPTPMGVSENSGVSPQIIPCLIGFSMIFTIHFGVKIPLFLVQHPNVQTKIHQTPGCEVAEACRREDEATHENHEATSGMLTVTGKGGKKPNALGFLCRFFNSENCRILLVAFDGLGY